MSRYHHRPGSRRNASLFDRVDFNPEIKRGVLAVFLFVLAGLSLLSFFDLAGLAGSFWSALLSVAFGKTRFALPVVLIVIGYLIEKEGEYDYKLTHFIGLILFFLSLNAIFHLNFPTDELVGQAIEGNGGGLFGVALAWPLKNYLDYWAALMILLALLVISLLFIFNMSLARLIETHRVFFAHLGWVGRSILSLAHVVAPPKVTDQEETSFSSRPLLEEEDTTDADYDEEETSETAEEEVEEGGEEDDAATETEEGEAPVRKKITRAEFHLPPLSLLYTLKSKPTAGDIKTNSAIIQETLANFGISVDVGEIQVGPTVTQYAIKPNKGVKLNRITALHNDLALALAAHPIRIEAPIPGKSLVGIEVPNQRVAMVTLRELLEEDGVKPNPTGLVFTLGKDVAGKPQFADLNRMPHLLIAGATNSGKTVAINTLIASLLYQHTPETLRFIMVDPKRVELPVYNGIPHLLTPVITNVNKTVGAIKWAIVEMERRFDLLAHAGSRDVTSYNQRAKEPLPFIVFVIDELADLMATSGAEVEAGIVRLAQMARAVGIHLVIATQRPSVDVITGLMKANIPARIAFSVASIVDSRTILDNSGAEKLL
ncbi:MAG: DNA translocase FtsK 4TM domain-containing protein [Candidatus Magasanikbacteria bacterium]|nr:DNA translocase FtsK 4TM domain-containing protein [Candidatus Magasanikbacteria bacterium]